MEEKSGERKMYKVWAIWNYVEAFLLLGAGACGITFGALNRVSSDSPINIILAIVVGIFVVLDGILRLFMSFYSFSSSEESIMLVAGFEVAIGITIILSYTVFIDIIIQFLAVLLLVIGVLLILFSIFSIAKKVSKPFMPILEIVFGAILAGVGSAILIMYFGSDVGTTNKITVLIVGIIMVLASIAQGVIATIQYKKGKKKYELAKTGDGEEEPSKKPRKDKKKKSNDNGNAEKVIDVIEEKPEEPKKIGQNEKIDNEKDGYISVE